MILLRIMVEMLIAICKIKTGHASLRTFARKVKFSKVLGNPRTDCTEDPIEISATLNTGALMTEIPDMTSPRLQFDEFHGRILQNLDLDDSCVHRICPYFIRRRRLVDIRHRKDMRDVSNIRAGTP